MAMFTKSLQIKYLQIPALCGIIKTSRKYDIKEKEKNGIMEKIILDLCGGTGSWSKPYKDNGYSVYNITLPYYDVFECEMYNRQITFFSQHYGDIILNANKIYGILAAPTCTMFSLARTTALTPRDFAGGIQLVQQCLNIIFYARASEKSMLKFWALENPFGYLRQFLGRPPFTFSPNEYGESYTKKTDLWGYFNEPIKAPHTLSPEEKARCKDNTRVLPDLPEDYILPPGWNKTAARRSMTSPKFAQAFYNSNK